MTTQQIQLLVLILPPNCPYFHRVFGLRLRQQQPSLTERLQVAFNDPALLWNIVQSYGEANLPLPQFQWPASIWRAYEFVTDPECIDENLTQAQELQTPERWAERDLIRALLMCPDATDERIAEVLGLDVEVIQLFELWWNFRSRSRELLYAAQLVNGRDWVAEPQDESAPGEFGIRLMRVARVSGKFEAVLLAAGRKDPSEMGRVEELLEQIERAVLTEAWVRQQSGFIGKEHNPALALAEKYLLSQSETPESDLIFSDPLLALSLNKRAQLVVREHLQRQAAERMRAEREYEREKAQDKRETPEYEI